MAEAGGAFWVHVAQALLQQGHPEQGAQTGLQGGDPTACGQPVPVLWHLHSTAMLPGVQRESHVLQFVPTASCPGSRHH